MVSNMVHKKRFSGGASAEKLDPKVPGGSNSGELMENFNSIYGEHVKCSILPSCSVIITDHGRGLPTLLQVDLCALPGSMVGVEVLQHLHLSISCHQPGGVSPPPYCDAVWDVFGHMCGA